MPMINSLSPVPSLTLSTVLSDDVRPLLLARQYFVLVLRTSAYTLLLRSSSKLLVLRTSTSVLAPARQLYALLLRSRMD
jgi:hypothetical protein